VFLDGEHLLQGIDLTSVFHVRADRAWNIVDYLYARDIASHTDIDGGIETVRKSLASVYDYDYRTTKELYGGSNDEDGFVPDGDDERVDSPFVSQFDPKRDTRPTSWSNYAQTPQSDSGFAGLDAPLG
jgi:hypothetical protein